MQFTSISITRIKQYTDVLRTVDYGSLMKNKEIYLNQNKVVYYKNNFSSKENEFKTLMYSLMIHPLDYKQYGKLKNWYIFDSVTKLDKLYFYKSPDLKNYVETCILSQQAFVNKIKSIQEISPSIDDITNYERFLYLCKKHQGIMLVPLIGIDIVWHAHMLDHENYVKDTTRLFGHVLNHNDSQTKEDLDESFKRTEILWENEYNTKYLGKNVSTSSCSGITNNSATTATVLCGSCGASCDSGGGGCGGDGGGCGSGSGGGCGGGCGGGD